MTTISRDAASRIPNRDLLERSASGALAGDSVVSPFDLLLTPARPSDPAAVESVNPESLTRREPPLSERRGADRRSGAVETPRRAEDHFSQSRRERTERRSEEPASPPTALPVPVASKETEIAPVESEDESVVLDLVEAPLVATVPSPLTPITDADISATGEIEVTAISEVVEEIETTSEGTLEIDPALKISDPALEVNASELAEVPVESNEVKVLEESVASDSAIAQSSLDFHTLVTAATPTTAAPELTTAETLVAEVPSSATTEAATTGAATTEVEAVQTVSVEAEHAETRNLSSIEASKSPLLASAVVGETSEKITNPSTESKDAIAVQEVETSPVAATEVEASETQKLEELEETEGESDSKTSLQERFLSAISEAFGIAHEPRHAQESVAQVELAAPLPAEVSHGSDVRADLPLPADSNPTPVLADIRQTGALPNTVHHQEAGALRRAGTGMAHQGLSRAEHRRFLSRVGKAFQAAEERGGEIRLRLSPPRLGALKLEVRVEGDKLAARVETETEAARQLILEQLPTLRDRLSERGISIESFEVDLYRDAPSHGDDPRKDSSQGRDERQRSAGMTIEPVAEAQRVECHLFGNGPSSRLDVKA